MRRPSLRALPFRPTATVRRAVFVVLLIGIAAALRGQTPQRAAPAASGVRLDDLSWPAAEQRLTAESIVVLPLGAAALEHGLHLKLGTDRAIADYLTRRLVDLSDVVAAPALPYHYSPGFTEYPGSTSLSLNTARDMTADVVRSFARQGPRRFYVVNVGLSSSEALAAAAKVLAGEGVLLRYTDWRARIDAARATLRQPGGDHAGEFESSLMLYIDPSAVTMANAQRDYNASQNSPLQLTRRQGTRGTYSPTGAWGDPTLATRDKGRILVEGLVAAIKSDVDDLRGAPLPAAGAVAPETLPTAQPGRSTMPSTAPVRAGECQPGEERYIREIGPAFYSAWRDQDPEKIVSLWAQMGDMAHPDGLVESTPEVIKANRAFLFRQREYRGSRHDLTIGTVRCVTRDVAVADCKWELRGVTDARGNLIPAAQGLCTLVVRRAGGSWLIEAWRYNMKPSASSQPTILTKPGWPTPIIR